jgi:RNA polymerase sigma-70 factor (ECF subfamily)
VLAELMPDEPEALGLLALLLFLEARRPTRTGPHGELVLLADQDRSRWDRALLDEARAIVRRCQRRGAPGPYQLQAAINAVHSDAAGVEDTDWPQVLALYDHLLAVHPTPVVALNRAVALAEVEGPNAGLAAVQALDLDGYQPYHVVRAELLARLGRPIEADTAFARALELTDNAVERRHLARRRCALR